MKLYRILAFILLFYVISCTKDLPVSPTPPGQVKKHLLISEICFNPTSVQFIEIYNPTEKTVDLTHYYLSDIGNSYYLITDTERFIEASESFSPYDFMVKFPVHSKIKPGDYIVVACSRDILTTYTNNQKNYYYIPELSNFYSSTGAASLTDAGESIILFYWDGVSDLIKDVDIVHAGAIYWNIDKSGKSIDGPDADHHSSTYKQELANMKSPPKFSTNYVHVDGCSLKRIIIPGSEEPFEAKGGGNGIYGDDETSEDLSRSFINNGLPTPGRKD